MKKEQKCYLQPMHCFILTIAAIIWTIQASLASRMDRSLLSPADNRALSYRETIDCISDPFQQIQEKYANLIEIYRVRLQNRLHHLYYVQTTALILQDKIKERLDNTESRQFDQNPL